MLLDEEYWFIDRFGKTLGVTTDLKVQGYPEIRSIEPIMTMEGEEMIVEGQNVERVAYLTELLNALTGEGLIDRVAWIDLKDPADPCLYYDGRLTVYFGERENTAYKTALLVDVLRQLAPDDSGTLHYAGGSAWNFSPD